MKKQQDDFETFLMVDPSGISEQIKKMYNLLNSVESDDLITIEDHKKYLELLRKFRQVNLETMRFMGKRFVETLESLLSVGEDGVYSNNYRFIYELIQNVDDCDYKDVKDCHLDMQFQYQNNPGRIVLTYNELGFTPQNVFAITGIAEASKNINAEKVEIGEKGIGFKSVFGIADKVYIESGMFSFSLSKENFTVPEPHYENFVPVKGTRMTLEMPADKCKEVYRALVNQYMKKDAVLNKNPVLFLNKLTHLKLYFDGFRYLEFNVERKEPVCRNGLRIEEEVALSVNMEDYINGISQKHKSEILCYRYTTPLVYGEIACKSRYGIDTAFSERKHNLVAVLRNWIRRLKISNPSWINCGYAWGRSILFLLTFLPSSDNSFRKVDLKKIESRFSYYELHFDGKKVCTLSGGSVLVPLVKAAIKAVSEDPLQRYHDGSELLAAIERV